MNNTFCQKNAIFNSPLALVLNDFVHEFIANQFYELTKT